MAEIIEMEPGEIVPAFKAQIKEVKPISDKMRGTNEYGPWTIQKITLMDSTGIMTAKLFNVPEYTAQWQGVWIYVECTQSDKGKLRGIEIVKDTYRDKETKQLKISEMATISQVKSDTAAPQQQAATPAQPATMPPPASISPTPKAPTTQEAPQAPAPEPSKQNGQARAAAPTKPTEHDTKRSISDARARLGQAANGLILCYDAAIYVANEVTKKHPEITIPLFGPDQLEKLAVHLSIALERGGLVFGLPTGPLEAWLKKKTEGGEA